MKLARVEIENYRAIETLHLPLDPRLTVLHGGNAMGKTSVLSAIATSLSAIPMLLPEVASIGFLKSDRRGSQPLRVGLTTTDGVAWDRRKGSAQQRGGQGSLKHLKQVIDLIVAADQDGEQGEATAPLELPILAFYDTDRAVLDPPQRRRGFKREFPRYGALQGALSARTDFRDFFKWFDAKEREELEEQKERRNFDYQHKDLQAVRRAIEAMLPGVTNPRILSRPLRFVVSVEPGNGKPEQLAINQLSGGYRIMLALAADLARRMAQGNPHLDNPLQSEAVVLIDELDLHLHPSWQQRVLTDLRRAFPNTQFIVSTHSPQVLTTVKPEHIVELGREQGKIVAGSAGAPTYGAEAGDVLAAVMGVEERPPGNEFVKALNEYRSLVSDGQGESEAARKLRQELEALSPRDHALNRADMEMRRRKLLQNMGKS